MLALLLLATGMGQIIAAPLVSRPSSRGETLAGHERIHLAVRLPENSSQLRALGVRRASLEQFVLNLLRGAGIDASTEYSDQTLTLQMSLETASLTDAGRRIAEVEDIAYLVELDAIQGAKLATNRQAALVSTWRTLQLGLVRRGATAPLRQSVERSVTTFIAQWKLVHPAPRPDDQEVPR